MKPGSGIVLETHINFALLTVDAKATAIACGFRDLEHALGTILSRGYEGLIVSVTNVVYQKFIDENALGGVLEYS